MELDKIYNMDCLQGLKQLADESVDLICTDPPYKVTARGNAGNSGGMMQKDIYNSGKVFKYNDIDIEEYLPEFYRVLKDGSHCYIMCNHVNLVHFLKVIDESDFHFIKCLIWQKNNAVMGTFYMNCFEYIIFLRKGTAKPINDCGCGDILSFANVKDKRPDGTNLHDSQKPVGLMHTLITNSTKEGDVVLEPFCGSGTTAIAAYKAKRHYIAFEIDKEYYDISCDRFKKECLGEWVTKNGHKVKELSLFD